MNSLVLGVIDYRSAQVRQSTVFRSTNRNLKVTQTIRCLDLKKQVKDELRKIGVYTVTDLQGARAKCRHFGKYHIEVLSALEDYERQLSKKSNEHFQTLRNKAAAEARSDLYLLFKGGICTVLKNNGIESIDELIEKTRDGIKETTDLRKRQINALEYALKQVGARVNLNQRG